MRIFCSNRKVEWDDLSGSDQMAVSKANDLINYEGEGIWDAAYSACNMISEANEYCEDFDDGFSEPDFEKVFSYLKSEHGVESSVSIQASSHDKAYVVTFGWDEGGPESGPIWKSGEDIVYAPSEQDACRIWEEENISNITNYEGCWARLAKPDEIEDYNKEMARQEEIDKWLEENGYLDGAGYPEDYDGVVESSTWMSKARDMGYSVDELKDRYLDETGNSPEEDPSSFQNWCKDFFREDTNSCITSSIDMKKARKIANAAWGEDAVQTVLNCCSDNLEGYDFVGDGLFDVSYIGDTIQLRDEIASILEDAGIEVSLLGDDGIDYDNDGMIVSIRVFEDDDASTYSEESTGYFIQVNNTEGSL